MFSIKYSLDYNLKCEYDCLEEHHIKNNKVFTKFGFTDIGKKRVDKRDTPDNN